VGWDHNFATEPFRLPLRRATPIAATINAP
jgi:hypothetical protein